MPLTNAYRNYLVQAALGEAVTPFNNGNAHLGVGDGATGFDPVQTDLQGSNKTRKAMDTSFPTRNGNVATFRATFGTSEANYAWNEWGVFNASSGGTMMNRKVEALGTKTSAQSWQIEVQITLNVA